MTSEHHYLLCTYVCLSVMHPIFFHLLCCLYFYIQELRYLRKLSSLLYFVLFINTEKKFFFITRKLEPSPPVFYISFSVVKDRDLLLRLAVSKYSCTRPKFMFWDFEYNIYTKIISSRFKNKKITASC